MYSVNHGIGHCRYHRESIFGQKDVENTRYPREVMVSTVHKPELVEQAIETISAEKQAQLTKQVYLTSTKSIMFQPKNGNYQTTSAEDFTIPNRHRLH